MAHNPPSLTLLEACDRLGMIVMEEFFDVWNKPKIANDFHLFFEDWALRDAAWTVLRDRNHPSVFSYSIGNEIKEIDGTRGAEKWSKLLTAEVKKYDDTRIVTAGINQTKHQITLKVMVDIDVLVPWGSESTQVITEVLIADTVIVGQVPDTYLNLDAQNGG